MIKSDNPLNIIGTKATTQTQTEAPKESQKQDQQIHLAAMGDMLAHDTIIANAKTDSGYDFGKYFSNIRSSYKDSDMVFCDQEGLSSGEKYGISGYPSFNAPVQFASGLQSGAGCNVINLANNHIGDKGTEATNTTIDVWGSLEPLAISGANKNADDQNKVSYITINGIKISFIAFADFNNNSSTPSYSVNNYHDETLVRRLTIEARANADLVIVSMHWGTEDSNIVNDDQKTQVDLLSSLGADIIIGTGPHVLQKVQTVTRADGGKTVVWYSLGNMLSSQLNIKELIGGIAQFDVTKTDDGEILIDNLSFVPTYMHYEWTAVEEANGDLLARKNAMIYLLSSAVDPLSRSLFETTVFEQKQYVIDTLGTDVTVK
jgi:poly-gamma-glutamate synthesis protein (capsule biosynthesis protein)